jgi:hypothetical protein
MEAVPLSERHDVVLYLIDTEALASATTNHTD